MTDQQILEKALEKATANGFLWKTFALKNRINAKLSPMVFLTPFLPPFTFCLIFNHNFAKALWGEKEEIKSAKGEVLFRPYATGWQYHLQQMVIAEDPIKYLGDYLDG